MHFHILGRHQNTFPSLVLCTGTNRLLIAWKRNQIDKVQRLAHTQTTLPVRSATYRTFLLELLLHIVLLLESLLQLLYSLFACTIQKYARAAPANIATPTTHSKHTIPAWTYGSTLKSMCNKTSSPGVSFSMAISIQTTGRTVLSNGFTRLLNLDVSSSKFIWIREWTRIGTPSC